MCDRLARRSVQPDDDVSVLATRPPTTATAVDISPSPGQSDTYVSVVKGTLYLHSIRARSL